MVGTFPIRWDGQVHGKLTARKEGVHTVFEGECEDPGTMVRLWVIGDGKRGYLGLMEPESGKLVLRRRMSPLSLRELPEEILYAAPETEAPDRTVSVTAAKEGNTADRRPRSQKNTEPAPETPALRTADKVTEERKRNPPSGPEMTERDTELLWYELGDGSLYTIYRGQGYRAIPVAAYGLSDKGVVERRRINGREYAVYAVQNGRMQL